MDRLPDYGEWHLSNNLIYADPPFAVLTVDFRANSGTVRYLQQTTQLTRIARLAPNKFGAMYVMGRDKGLIEAEYRDDQTLTIKFIGSVNTECTARPINLIGGERPISGWSTQEKLGAAIRRSLPLLPPGVRDEVAAMLTPGALAIMAGVTVLWGVSHFFGVGEIADAILVVTGGLMLGAAAIDVAKHLAGFVEKATRAQSEADLDAAAKHFAEAVAKGGVQVVLTILLCRGSRAASRRATRPARQGELPTELNAVAPSKIPSTSRLAAAVAEQGQQPRLAGVPEELAQMARALLNRIRRTDLTKETDCWGECQKLMELAGGSAQEGNATSRLTRFDHTMWFIGGEYVDSRPGMWIKHFREHPEIRAAIEEVLPGLAERLERGAVLTIEEFIRFQGNRPAPKSPMFSDQPIPRPRGQQRSGG